MKKALVISNPGLIDPLAFELIGASTKRSDHQSIGFFGSGLKYAIAGMLRRGIDFQVWRGEEMLEITTQEVRMRDQVFNRIFFNGQSTSLTTDMGPRWEKWMLIRELYANSIDEGGEMAVTAEYHEFIAPGRTTIIIPDTDQVSEVLSDQDVLFCRGREIAYEDDKIRIYEEVGDGGFYVKGILVHRALPGYGYMMKSDPYTLNEERQLADIGSATRSTLAAILGVSDRKMVKRIVSRIKRDRSFESGIFMTWLLSRHTASDAWSDIVLFKKESKEYATEWNHVVVSDDVYNYTDGIQKWEDKKWTRSGTPAQNEALRVAVDMVDRELPGELPKNEWVFGTSISRSIGIGTEGGTTFVSDHLATEPPHIIAAHITISLCKDSGGSIKLLSKYFAR